jgi:predicted DNA-binding transcriptional regulator AlpA
VDFRRNRRFLVTKYLRFRDLKERGIVNNRPTLSRWIENEGFPPGRRLGPNTRVWEEREIEEYVASRPAAKKEAS